MQSTKQIEKIDEHWNSLSHFNDVKEYILIFKLGTTKFRISAHLAYDIYSRRGQLWIWSTTASEWNLITSQNIKDKNDTKEFNAVIAKLQKLAFEFC